MEKIAIFFTKPGFFDYPFDEKSYMEGYLKLGELFHQYGAECYLVRAQETYLGGNRFSGGWKFESGAFLRINGLIEVDVIFNKGILEVDEKANMVVPPEMDVLCTNKERTYELFEEFCPKTVEVQNEKDLVSAIEGIPSNIVVAKPLDAYGGEGVMIGPKEEILQKVRHFPYLIQEFIDTSMGIPGITESRHDFRIIIIDGEVVSTLLRVPKSGSLISNVAQGGSASVVPLEKIPPKVWELVKRVDVEFSRFPHRIYSIDMGLHQGRDWKIIELNCQPGLAIEDYYDGETGKKLFESVVKTLITAADKK